MHHQPGGTHTATVELLAQQLQVTLGMLSRFDGSCPDLCAGPGMGLRLRQEFNRNPLRSLAWQAQGVRDPLFDRSVEVLYSSVWLVLMWSQRFRNDSASFSAM